MHEWSAGKLAGYSEYVPDLLMVSGVREVAGVGGGNDGWTGSCFLALPPVSEFAFSRFIEVEVSAPRVR